MLRFSFCVICAIFIFCIPAQADRASKLNKKGIEAYNKQNTDESVRYFTDALVERPESPELRFNRGTALSAAGKTEDSVNELDRAASEFPQKNLSAAAYFNAGNTFFAAGDIEKAIEHYKLAVKLDQTSKDIRYNLELALQKQQQQQQNKDKEDQDNPDQENDQKDEDQKQQNQDRQEQEQENQPEAGQQQQPSREQTEQPMTPEEARRILDAMNNEEKKAFELRKQIMQEAAKQGDDW